MCSGYVGKYVGKEGVVFLAPLYWSTICHYCTVMKVIKHLIPKFSLISAHDPSIGTLFNINLPSVRSLTEYAGYESGKFC